MLSRPMIVCTYLISCSHESCCNVRHCNLAVAIFEDNMFVGILLATKVGVFFIEQIINILVVDLREIKAIEVTVVAEDWLR